MATDPKTLLSLNIKHHVPLTLDMEKVHYSSWAELFKITTRAHGLLHHIIPPSEKPTIPDQAVWGRLDAVVLQWIYGTISEDLMLTILEPDSTAQQAWDRLRDIFQDNKHSRAVYLENQFSNTQLENFKDVSSYCQKLKMLSDQLAGVGSPVSNQRLVLQLVAGLTDTYDNVASFIQQSDPLPPFYKARSMLTLEESRKAQQLGSSSTNALITTHDTSHGDSADENGLDHPPSTNRHPPTNSGRGRGRGGRGGRHNTNRGRGRGRSSQPYGQYRPPYGQQQPYFPSPYYGQGAWAYPPPAFGPPWAAGPCPYPTGPARQQRPPAHAGHGVLGSKPTQAYAATAEHSSHELIPTDINAAFHTMTLNPPDDNWYMDTGASSHMTGDSGTLSSYFNSSINKNIVVGNGNTIPVHGHGSMFFPNLHRPQSPLTLNHVLHAPQIIKNLKSYRHSLLFVNISILNLNVRLKVFNVIMVVSSIIYPSKNNVRNTACISASLAPTLPHKMVKRNAKFALLTTPFALSFFMLPFPPPFGLTP